MQSDRPADRYERKSDASLLCDDADPAAAFSELYSRHIGTIYAWFHRRLEWAASDLTAETLTRAWLARKRFRDDREGSGRSS
jgi:DNA-directed RNA polymerase specialized sigma24 family protein